MEVDPDPLGGQVRPRLLKQAVVMYQANRRQNTSATRSRGMVVGSTRKLYRQKGTGNARAGARRTHVRRGGGVAFAKGRQNFTQSMNKKMRRLARNNAILAKIVSDEVMHGGTLRMWECLHCEHRWTSRPKGRWVELGARMTRATRPLAILRGPA
ncbi:MAG: 50S ribosomal protein L4 [SAR324 cluster bacterium]|nr:50S ribosomal protein L4 [SAR324 cluster bacterium]